VLGVAVGDAVTAASTVNVNDSVTVPLIEFVTMTCTV
jgi:hypothetical protein